MRLLWRGEQVVDDLLKACIWLGALESPKSLDLGIVRVCHPKEEPRRARHPGLLTLSKILPDVRRVFSAIKALLEFRHI